MGLDAWPGNRTLTRTLEHARRCLLALLALLAAVPKSSERASNRPRARADAIAQAAGIKAAIAAGAISLPPGPLGWLTIPLEFFSVWRIQVQMVADIAAVYGRTCMLSQSFMEHCLFERLRPQVVRDLALRVGQPFLVHVVTRGAVCIGRSALGRGVARVLPVMGAAANAYCARADTGRVAGLAIALFEAEIASARALPRAYAFNDLAAGRS
jgi:hypothetical protein